MKKDKDGCQERWALEIADGRYPRRNERDGRLLTKPDILKYREHFVMTLGESIGS